MKRNLYVIDDVLLKAGSVILLGVVVAAEFVFGSGLAQSQVVGWDSGIAALRGRAHWLVLAALFPIGLIAAGLVFRRRERRVRAIWHLLGRSTELRVSDLVANSDFDRAEIVRTLRLLNNRGLGHYVWDRASDTIEDARLRSIQLHVDKCDACGAAISLRVPIGLREAPRCPYCRGPVSTDSLEQRKRDAMAALRAEYLAAEQSGRPGWLDMLLGRSLTFFRIVFVVLGSVVLAYACTRLQRGL